MKPRMAPLAAFVLLSVSASALLVPGAVAGRPPTLAALVTAVARRSGGSAVIAYAINRHRTFLTARGFANPATHSRAQATTRIRIGSITKTFVAAVTLRLVAEGRVSLDDTVAKWRPGLLPQGNQITLRQLLSHRSGLFDYSRDADFLARAVADPRGSFTPEQLIGYANRHPLEFAPGTDASYSNTNFIVLGLIVEAVTGHAIGDEIRTRIVEPLRLANTFLLTTSEIPGDYAHVVVNGTDRSVVDPTRSWAAAGMVSTVPDLAHFFRALYAGRLFPLALVREMQIVTGRWESWRLGLGMLITRLRCGDAYGQDGFVDGYFTWAKFSRDGSRGTILTIVSSAGDDKTMTAFLNAGFCRR